MKWAKIEKKNIRDNNESSFWICQWILFPTAN